MQGPYEIVIKSALEILNRSIFVIVPLFKLNFQDWSLNFDLSLVRNHELRCAYIMQIPFCALGTNIELYRNFSSASYFVWL